MDMIVNMMPGYKTTPVRLKSQLERVRSIMSDGEWRTLSEIVDAISYTPYEKASEAGVSARLRDLRKNQFGGHHVDKRRRGEKNLWEYRLASSIK